MLNEFKQFIARGNVIDLAVGIIMGAAFTGIVNSLVKDIIMPPIGLLLGNADFSNLFIDLSGQRPVSLADAQLKGLPVVAYGLFINDVIAFLIIAFVIFWIVKAVNRRRETAAPTLKDCTYCLTPIPIAATRCAACCSEVIATVVGEAAVLASERLVCHAKIVDAAPQCPCLLNRFPVCLLIPLAVTWTSNFANAPPCEICYEDEVSSAPRTQ